MGPGFAADIRRSFSILHMNLTRGGAVRDSMHGQQDGDHGGLGTIPASGNAESALTESEARRFSLRAPVDVVAGPASRVAAEGMHNGKGSWLPRGWKPAPPTGSAALRWFAAMWFGAIAGSFAIGQVIPGQPPSTPPSPGSTTQGQPPPAQPPATSGAPAPAGATKANPTTPNITGAGQKPQSEQEQKQQAASEANSVSSANATLMGWKGLRVERISFDFMNLLYCSAKIPGCRGHPGKAVARR